MEPDRAAFWKQWEGHVVDATFPLHQCLSSAEDRAVFLTEYGKGKPQRAVVKLVLADPQTVDLQLSLWQQASQLSHPNLIRLLKAGRCAVGDIPMLYVVTEHAEEVLSEVLSGRALTSQETREMLEPALGALGYLHRAGFVHAHLKPSNLLAVNDRLKISSDGLARIGEAAPRRTKPSVYDPPEIAAEGSSPAGDIWSLGVTLVECLTQRLPVWSEAERQEQILPETLPEPFRDIARHCLQPDPRNRWTVPEMQAGLRQTVPASGLRKLRYVLPAAVLGLLALGLWFGRRAPSEPLDTGVRPAVKVERPQNPPPQTAAMAPAKAAAPAPQKPKARAGDVLWTDVANQVLPEATRKARSTIHGKVTVLLRLRVAPQGDVTEATLESPDTSRYFDGLSLQAARKWKFRPVRVDDKEIAQEWTLRFEFTRSATTAYPARLSP